MGKLYANAPETAKELADLKIKFGLIEKARDGGINRIKMLEAERDALEVELEAQQKLAAEWGVFLNDLKERTEKVEKQRDELLVVLEAVCNTLKALDEDYDLKQSYIDAQAAIASAEEQ